MKTIKDIEFLSGVKVLVRVDFNVPINNDIVLDDFRIRSALPTIDFLRNKRSKIILISHLESSDGGNPSLAPIAKHLNSLCGKVIFIKDYKNAMEIIENGADGDCFLLENLRLYDGEKANDMKFSKELSSLADIYVNDAFSACHRKHASIVGVPKILPSYAGFQLEKEILNLSRAFDPSHPFLFILGGAKFETKLPLLEKFIEIADKIFVGGALSSDFFKLKGYEIGKSLISKGNIDLSRFLDNKKLLLPVDILNESKESISPDKMSINDKNMDSGPKTLFMLKEIIESSKFILWNGPLGVYEDGYKNATIELAKFIGNARKNGAITIVGGGDTLAAISELSIENQFTFISTGGGAMLDFLAEGTLPGIKALD